MSKLHWQGLHQRYGQQKLYSKWGFAIIVRCQGGKGLGHHHHHYWYRTRPSKMYPDTGGKIRITGMAFIPSVPGDSLLGTSPGAVVAGGERMKEVTPPPSIQHPPNPIHPSIIPLSIHSQDTHSLIHSSNLVDKLNLKLIIHPVAVSEPYGNRKQSNKTIKQTKENRNKKFVNSNLQCLTVLVV